MKQDMKQECILSLPPTWNPNCPQFLSANTYQTSDSCTSIKLWSSPRSSMIHSYLTYTHQDTQTGVATRATECPDSRTTCHSIIAPYNGWGGHCRCPLPFDMANILSPSLSAMATVRSSIQSCMKMELSADQQASVIAPLLSTVNQWSSQLPILLEGTSPLNLVFSICKDLFIAPSFSQCVLGISLVDLPAPFQEFVTFIQKLIEAQKSDKDKTSSKVKSMFY